MMTPIGDASTTLSTRAGVLEAVSTTVKTSSLFDEFSDAISVSLKPSMKFRSTLQLFFDKLFAFCGKDVL